jgi:3-hydroxyisobutyrate dehydrogenase-like beta-hydroxyacid dehydrogenase
MAQRFMEAGFCVAGFDINPDCRENLRRMGGEALASAPAVADTCDRIVLSLPDSQVVEAVLGELESRLKPGAIVVDTTTGDPARMEALGKRLEQRGVQYLDVSVVGSSRQVKEGQAIVVAGGDAQAFDRCGDLFSCLAQRAFHLGPCGRGARMKLVVNLVLGLNRAVLAEGLAFAACCGLDPAVALEVLRAGVSYSRVMDLKGPKMLAREFTPEARLSQHLKDVRLILAAGKQHGARLPLSRLHRGLLEELEAAGLGPADNSAIIEAFRRS